MDFVTSAVGLGRPTFGLDRALQVAAELEDDEISGKIRAGS